MFTEELFRVAFNSRVDSCIVDLNELLLLILFCSTLVVKHRESEANVNITTNAERLHTVHTRIVAPRYDMRSSGIRVCWTYSVERKSKHIEGSSCLDKRPLFGIGGDFKAKRNKGQLFCPAS